MNRRVLKTPQVSDRHRLMLLLLAILSVVSLAVGALVLAEFAAFRETEVVWWRPALASLAGAAVLVIAGGTLLVRVCDPFIRRLEESEARTRAIVDTAGDGIITIDGRGMILSCNQAAQRMFECTEDRIVGHDVDELISLPSGFCFASEQAGQLIPNPAHPGHCNQRASGYRGRRVHFPIEFSLSRVSLSDRALYAVIVRDTTEREAAERQVSEHLQQLEAVKQSLEAKAAELSKANRELDDFAYIASHDLKEPLRGIGAYCDILLEEYGNKLDANGQRRLRTLVTLCQRLDRLIDDLLTMAKFSRTQPESTLADLNEIARDALETLAPAAEKRGAAVYVKGELPRLEADRVWVGEVFRNLITNALKFNDSPQPVVEVGSLDGTTIYVRDNGIGIAECHHEAIFGMFRRLHSRHRYDGTGTGLSLVRKIVEAHGGRVWLESTVGVGTTFYFTLSNAAGRRAPLQGPEKSRV